MYAVEPIRSKLKVMAIKSYLKDRSARDYLLFCLGINTALRVSDLLKLKVGDVVDRAGQVKKILRVREGKTGKERRIVVNDQVRSPLLWYFKQSPALELGDYLFTAKLSNKPITRIRVHQIISKAAVAVGLMKEGERGFSCHSMRKTYGFMKRKAGFPMELIMERLGHSSPSITKRYIGITSDEVAELDKTGI